MDEAVAGKDPLLIEIIHFQEQLTTIADNIAEVGKQLASLHSLFEKVIR